MGDEAEEIWHKAIHRFESLVAQGLKIYNFLL